MRQPSGGGPIPSALLVVATGSDPPPGAFGRESAIQLRPLSAVASRRLFLDVLKPLTADRRLVEAALAEAQGSCRAPRRIAGALAEEWRTVGSIPAEATLPERARLVPPSGTGDPSAFSDVERRVLQSLLHFDRAASREEIAWIIDEDPRAIATALRRLVRLELVLGHGRPRRYQATHPDALGDVAPRLSRLDARAAMRLLEEYEWPGNVRELEGVLLRVLVMLSGGESLGAPHLAGLMHGASQAHRGGALLERSLEDWRQDLDKEYLTELFYVTRGSARLMTERLRIRRTTLYAWFKKLGIDVRELRAKL